ncbi:cellulose biosynthesis protein BcsD [Halomonas sp. SpR8]|uniref:cellulose biosynthesis protein BcsD n=1 Tax=Halomonas sp. SpR8 TaxID=3050463 RepID=UPI0027E44CAC|nr:cellulose biosynthesis protein BcsD [Halomonas sp. SpR8]MDQ7728409.1 cellulose biosynthesis protein BcsD [Halomonas sp. SpR8]
MNEPDKHTQHLDYYAKRHCSIQWRLFLELVFDELSNSAGKEESSGFWRHIGSRIASERPIGECATLERLELAVNEQLDLMDWGWASIMAENQTMRICHAACPVPGSSQERLDASLLAMSALLEGVYKGWLQQQGGDSDVPIRCVSRNLEQRECTFLYGR